MRTSTKVVVVTWLVGINRMRGKIAFSCMVYFNGVVSVYSCVIRFESSSTLLTDTSFVVMIRLRQPIANGRCLECCFPILFCLCFPH